MRKGTMMETIGYRRINTESLWNSYSAHTDNLSVEDGCLQLNTHWIYEFGKVLFEDKTVNMTDVAADECDNLYIVDHKNDLLLRFDSHTGIVKKTGCKPGILPVTLWRPAGIAVDVDSIYISDTGNDRLVALARSNLQIRWILAAKSPSDLAMSERRNLYVLEAGAKRVLRVTRGGNIEGFIDLGAMAQPTDIALDKEGKLYVLDRKMIHVFKQNGTEEKTPIALEFTASGVSVDKENNVFVGEAAPDDPHKTLYKIDADGKATPLWSYRGSSRRLVNDSKGNLYVINIDGNKLTFLKYTRANSPNRKGIFSASYISRALDSGVSGTHWHRFLMEGKFTKGTQVDFSYYASDEKLADHRVGTEDHPWYTGIGEGGIIQGEEKRDALFHEKEEGTDLKGRYLYVKLVLSGTESLSPLVRALTVFFPRITYLRYLPAFYQKDPVSRTFLERFLSIFESIIADCDFTVQHLSRFFDAVGTPSEFLPWLASWLSLMVEEKWPDNKKRLFIQKAPQLYKKRGTRVGLEETLNLYLETKDGLAGDGKKPYYIVEHLFMDRLSEKENLSEAGEDADALFYPHEISLSTALFGEERFSFCVLLRASTLSNISIETVRRIVEEQKPAHTCYGVKVLEPWFYLDMHTYLGVNTALTKPQFVLGEKSVIGRDTVLDDLEQSGQVGRRARVGIDTQLT